LLSDYGRYRRHPTIGVVIVAIGVLVAAIVLAHQRSATFRRVEYAFGGLAGRVQSGTRR
jgi:hypothetical protein